MRAKHGAGAAGIADIIPGITLFRLGDRAAGSVFLAFFALALIVIAAHAISIFRSLYSLLLSLWLAIVDTRDSSVIFSLDVTDFWLASITAVALPFALIFASKRSAAALRSERDGESGSEWTVAMRRLRANPVSRWGGMLLFVLYAIALLTPLLSPYNPNSFQDGVVTQYKPPLTRLTALVFDRPRGGSVSPALDRVHDRHEPALKRLLILNNALLEDPIRRLMFVDGWHVEEADVVATQGDELIHIPIALLAGAEAKQFKTQRTFILGTDSYGRDVFSRLMYGSRISLSIGFVAVLLSITLGVLIGLVSGYIGRMADTLLMRTVDVLLAFPSLFLILIVVAVLDDVAIPRIMVIVLVLGFTSWMGVARLVRGDVLSVRELDFVMAAQAAGFGHARIIFRHILPNVLTPVIVNATLRIGGMILIEAALSFLNLGVQQPPASWGSIIFEGKDHLARAWWISSFPGLAIIATVVCFNLLGDGLRDAFDPRLNSS